jgi:cytochrome c-type biogenesis protein CcmE
MSENLHNQEPALEAKRSKVLLLILLGLVVVVGIGLASVTMVGGSVLYYKTPTEVAAQGPDVAVRLAGQLVLDSVGKDAQGGTTFKMTDGKTIVAVVYRGGATTALATASKPGTQMVAEGTLGTDGTFQATALMAKCPSKFATASPVAQPAS